MCHLYEVHSNVIFSRTSPFCKCLFLQQFPHRTSVCVLSHWLQPSITYGYIRLSATTEVRVRAPVSPCGICGGKGALGQVSLPSCSVPCQYHPTMTLHTRHLVDDGRSSETHSHLIDMNKNINPFFVFLIILLRFVNQTFLISQDSKRAWSNCWGTSGQDPLTVRPQSYLLISCSSLIYFLSLKYLINPWFLSHLLHYV
jgi:hypothetical protein